jgi:hypothetical protein
VLFRWNPTDSHNYARWDSFDAEKALAEVDSAAVGSSSSPSRSTCSSSGSAAASSSATVSGVVLEDEPDQLSLHERRTRSLAHKQRGNGHFSAQRYGEAIDCYSLAERFDPHNVVLPANRAMCYLKLKE